MRCLVKSGIVKAHWFSKLCRGSMLCIGHSECITFGDAQEAAQLSSMEDQGDEDDGNSASRDGN